MSNIERSNRMPMSHPINRPASRSLDRSLNKVEATAIVRTANVRAEGYVQAEKLREIDNLVHHAMTGQALLAKWAATLAQGDPFIGDELKFFTDLARIGKGEIIAETVASFGREGAL